MKEYRRRIGHLPVSRLRAAHLLGIHNEKRALTIIGRMKEELGWLTNVRMASQEEDQQGIDIVCDTTDGIQLYVQVKSSTAGLRKYLHTYKKGFYGIIPVITIKVHLWRSDESIMEELKEQLTQLREILSTLGMEYWKRSQADLFELQKISLKLKEGQMDPVGAQKLLTAIQATSSKESWLKDVCMTPFFESATETVIRLTGDQTSLYLVCLKSTKAIREMGEILFDNIHRSHILTIIVPPKIDDAFVYRLFRNRLTPAYERAITTKNPF
ncbi:hypothetical protein HYV70_00275 [Candidatus Uhrbacteria bacterium]|nr:hypothetical protein [Candidatus Uhrbacteria bacterium]